MDDAWLLFPLALIVMMTGANPLSPVPLLMLLLMTNTLTRLLPNPIPVLDYPVIDFAPAPPAALSQSTAQLQRQGTAAPCAVQLGAERADGAVQHAPVQQTEASEGAATEAASASFPPLADVPSAMPSALREKRHALLALVRERVGVPSFSRTANAVLPPSLFPNVRSTLGVL